MTAPNATPAERPMTAPRIVALWAVPRSTSTAFEWMMRMRGDFTCFHEPFGEVWYQGDAPDWPRYRPGESVRTPGLTYETRWRELRRAARRGPVFVKEFPMYLERLWSDAFFDRFAHSFLIRHPLKTLSSMHKHWPDFDIVETGFAQQRRLFDELRDRGGGQAPPVIDSDDLLADPRGVVEAWCTAMGCEFIPSALSWAPGERAEVSWWDGGSFHQNLRDSDGLKPQPTAPVVLDEAPERVRDALPELLPHYEHLRRFRIAAGRLP